MSKICFQQTTGVFALIGDSGSALGDFGGQQHATVGANKQQEANANKLNELVAQWPISVEFKSTPAGQTNNGGAQERQCVSLTHWAANNYDDQANRCQLTRSNGTHFVCTCDKFGFISLAINPNSALQFAVQGDFQWAPSTPISLDSLSNELEPQSRQPYESPFIQSTNKVASTGSSSLGLTSTVLVCLGVCLLIFFVAAFVVQVAQRRAAGSHSRLGKKQQSFLDALNGLGGNTGPPTGGSLAATEHNLMGSDPLVSGSATQSASIIGLAGSAGAAANQASYKAHNQQLYAAAHLSHSSYSTGLHSTDRSVARRLVGWIARPSRWLANIVGGGAANGLAKGERSMIHHRVLGGSSALSQGAHSMGAASATLAYKTGQCQNGYTTSMGLYHPSQQHHHQQRPFMNGGRQQHLNSSSNSSYVSSSAYYEEIGPGNLTKVNTNQLATQTTIVDPFKTTRAGQEYHWQQQQMNNQVSACTLNPANQQHNFAFQHGHLHAGQHAQHLTTNRVASANQQHIHSDLSPLQSSSGSSSAGSQHSSAATSVTNAANSTPRHYLFASPTAVNAYKQQQQQQFRLH